MPPSGLAKAADSIEAFIKPIYTWLTYIGAAVLGALVLTMIWSILGRRFFNAPLKGATEITQLALAVMTFLVLGLEHMGHEKMTVDIVIKHFSKRAQAIIAPIIYILVIGILCHRDLAVGEAGHHVPERAPDAAQYPGTHLSVRVPGGFRDPHLDPHLHSAVPEIC